MSASPSFSLADVALVSWLLTWPSVPFRETWMVFSLVSWRVEGCLYRTLLMTVTLRPRHSVTLWEVTWRILLYKSCFLIPILIKWNIATILLFNFILQIKYQCVPGFELVGKDTRYCQSDGTWTPSELPTCVPVQCKIPDSPVNGKALYTAVAYKSVVTYKCKHGFMIVGDSSRTCGEDKHWSGEMPKCKEINCGSMGNLANGYVDGGRQNLYATVTFRCYEDMTFEGESKTSTCQPDGTWSHPLPKCYASCHIPDIPMGYAINHTIGTLIQHGDSIQVECDDNYELAVSGPIECFNGTFESNLKCEPARCKTLPTPPLNGMVVVPETKHGGVGLYQCKDGYDLKGSNVTTCNYGNWSGNTPRCELIYCEFPGYVKGGKVSQFLIKFDLEDDCRFSSKVLLVGNMGLYDYRPYVKKVINNRQIMFECGRNALLVDGPPGATCIAGK